MPISPYLRELRERVGTDLVLLPSATLLLWDRGRVALVRSAETGRWQTIGGAVDPDEHPADAALREAAEETGVTASLPRLRGVAGGPDYRVTYANGDRCAYVVTVYDADLSPGTEITLDEREVTELAWFAPADIPLDDVEPLSRQLLIDVGVVAS
jgi:8-oxo-dGTP pyrophosphatase MutT (NUDIX family)